MELVLNDFRWRWVDGYAVSGEYNVKDRSNQPLAIGGANTVDTDDIIGYSERTPTELLTLLLDALNIPMAKQDVSQVPDDTRPYVRWDYAKPGYELGLLAEQLGCQVVPTPDGGVSIQPTGSGGSLPTTNVIRTQQIVDPLPPPKNLIGVSGPVRIEADLNLVAVGLDTDGLIKPIGELSYTPAGGWGNFDLRSAHNVPNPDAVPLALESVFKWYQPDLADPAFSDLKYIKQITPIADNLLQVNQGTGQQFDGFVWGLYFDGADPRKNNVEQLPDIASLNLPAKAVVNTSYSVDNNLGVVKFNDPLCKSKNPSTASLFSTFGAFSNSVI